MSVYHHQNRRWIQKFKKKNELDYISELNPMGEAIVCRCRHPKLYHMSSAVTNRRTGKITPVEFCLECDCTKFEEQE
jgi:hypothetical protein